MVVVVVVRGGGGGGCCSWWWRWCCCCESLTSKNYFWKEKEGAQNFGCKPNSYDKFDENA